MSDLQKMRDWAYTERAKMLDVLALIASNSGLTVGIGHDPSEPDWPVVFIDTPAGQVSWHVSQVDYENHLRWLRPYPGHWDGHTTEEKWDRCEMWAEEFIPEEEERVEGNTP